MSPEAITADRVYHRLKYEIMTGRIPPGSSFNVQRLSTEYGVSVSPLRDALHRLRAERLVHSSTGGGFEILLPTIDALRALYAWHGQLAGWTLQHDLTAEGREMLGSLAVPAATPLSLARAADNLFVALALASQNPELIHAVRSASDRLFPLRLREPSLIPGVAKELQLLISTTATGSTQAARTALREYHRRRLRRIDRLWTALSAM